MTRAGVRIARRAGALRQRGVRTFVRFAWHEARFLARHGPSTFVSRGGRDGRNRDGVAAEPSRVAVAREAFGRLPPQFRGVPLLDAGCGRGRLLLIALDAGFRRVIGVEVDPGLAARAQRTVRGRGEVVVADVALWDVPDDIAVVAIFNPFGEATLTDLLAHLSRSMQRRPRPVAVVYLNPGHLQVVERAGFRLHWSGPDAAVLVSR